MTGEQMEAQAKIAEWREQIGLLRTAGDFNGNLEKIKGQSVAIREIFKAAALAKGLLWSKDHYAEPQKEAA